MRTVIIILSILLSFPPLAFGEETPASGDGVALLKDYRFEDGGYTVTGMTTERITHEIQKKLGDFYTDDIDVLNQMKASWVTDGPSPVFACGYHYEIFLTRDGEVLKSFAINLSKECNTVVAPEGYYYFDPQKLAAFAGRLKDVRREQRTFSSLKEGRDYIMSLAHAEDLLMYFTPDWATYDGEFTLDIPCDARDLTSFQFEACKKDIEAKIHKAYPGEPFALVESSRSSDGKMSLTVKSRKTLYAQTRLIKGKETWKDYTPTLSMLWKAGAGPEDNLAQANCDNSVYYSCNVASDTLRVYDRSACGGTDNSKDAPRPITFMQGEVFVTASATCELEERTYQIKVSPCMAGGRQVPLVHISSQGKTVFTGSYGAECGDARPLIYFHFASSDGVEIGKRVLRWKKR